jgi:hypothetical protein
MRFPTASYRHFVVSSTFSQAFRRIGSDRIFARMGHLCARRKRGPLADEELALRDDNGISHRFHVECFSNTYDVLTLGTSLGVRHQMPYEPGCRWELPYHTRLSIWGGAWQDVAARR